MSYFSALVLSAAPLTRDSGESFVRRQLAPYDENLDVAVYETVCWCVGDAAERDASERFAGELPRWKEELEVLRGQLRALDQRLCACTEPDSPPALISVGRTAESLAGKGYCPDPALVTEERALARRWFAHWALQKRTLEKLAALSPYAGHANGHCETCAGTGRHMTTRNPDGRWDWFAIGGRWSGLLTGEEPYLDPANHQPCTFCRTTGVRYIREEVLDGPPARATMGVSQNEAGAWIRVRATSKDDTAGKPLPCNGCDGTGVSQRPFSQWVRYDGDVCPVAELAENVELRVFAMVTPDGRWHAKGQIDGTELGDDTSDVIWRQHVRDTLGSYAAGTAVIVDCHS